MPSNDKQFKNFMMLHFVKFFILTLSSIVIQVPTLVFLLKSDIYTLYEMRVVAISFLHAVIPWYTLGGERWSLSDLKVLKDYTPFYGVVWCWGSLTSFFGGLSQCPSTDTSWEDVSVEILIPPSEYPGIEDKSEGHYPELAASGLWIACPLTWLGAIKN